MNKKVTTIIIFAVLLFSAGICLAEAENAGTAAVTKISDAREGLISLDLKNADVVEVLKLLALRGKMNIVTTDAVKGRVTLLLNNVSINDILEVVLLTNGLAYDMQGDIMTVMTASEYESLYGQAYTDKRTTKIVELQYAEPDTISSALSEIKSSIGKTIIDGTTGTVILIDTPEKIALMQDTIARLDRVPDTKVFNLNYAEAKEVEGKLATTLTASAGKIVADERTNTVIVSDLKEKMNEIKTKIELFDQKTKQVIIDAKIVQIRLNDDYAMGIDWEKTFKNPKFNSLDFVGSFPVTSALSAFQRISIGTLSRDAYTITFDMLRTLGETKILSSPHITALNNQEAKILVGTREAYVTQTISQGEVTTTTAESIEFVDVGVKLYVTPTINNDGYISMSIKPEVSSVTSTLTTSQNSIIPIIKTSEAETSVMVKDGNTIIIAGLIEETNEDTVKKTPLLGDIPLLGHLFKSTVKESLKTELVVLITPHIITGDDEIVSVSSGVKKRKPMKE